MSMVLTRRANSRVPTSDEQVDQIIKAGDYFGTTCSKGGHVWKFDGSTAIRVGIPNPDHLSKTALGPGESLRDALARVPMFVGETFVLHRMVLPPGAYYPRVARPSSQHTSDGPGYLPIPPSADILFGSLNQMRSLVGMLDLIFQSVHPAAANMNCYGSAIRSLIILACTECEAQWRGVLIANSYNTGRLKTDDFVKLLPAMRLDEYHVKFTQFPWLPAVAPYAGWSSAAPTQTLPWYDAYNAVKHDREAHFDRASLSNAISSIAAAWVMISAQFGAYYAPGFADLNRYFYLEHVPLWRYSDVYYGYDGTNASAYPQNYPF